MRIKRRRHRAVRAWICPTPRPCQCPRQATPRPGGGDGVVRGWNATCSDGGPATAQRPRAHLSCARCCSRRGDLAVGPQTPSCPTALTSAGRADGDPPAAREPRQGFCYQGWGGGVLGDFLEEATLDLRPGLGVGVDRRRWKVGPGKPWWGVFSSFQGHWDPTEGREDPRLQHPPQPPEGSLSASSSQGRPPPPVSTRPPQLTFLPVPKGKLLPSTTLLRKKMYQ